MIKPRTTPLTEREKAISMFIWCEKDLCNAKFKDFNGTPRREWMNNTVGPSRHINSCLRGGCTCDKLEVRIEELYGDLGKVKDANVS